MFGDAEVYLIIRTVDSYGRHRRPGRHVTHRTLGLTSVGERETDAATTRV